MAKLSARGRYALAEITREVTEEILQRQTDRKNADLYPDGLQPWDGQPLSEVLRLSLTTHERFTQRLMSDGNILEKQDVVFRASMPYEPNGRKHSYGWKVKGKAKPEYRTAAAWLNLMLSDRNGKPSPWRKVER